MKAKGMTLLDLLVALAMISIIGTLLYTSLFQSQKVAEIIERTSDLEMKFLLVQRQLKRDLTGIYAPAEFLDSKKSDKKNNDINAEKNQKKEAEIDSTAKKKRAFFAAKDDKNNIKKIQFTTNNPLALYGAVNARNIKPLQEEVVYILEPEKQSGQISYMLKRQTLFSDEKKKKEEYELISGIKHMKMKFVVIAEEEKNSLEESSSSVASKEKKEKVIKKYDDWVVDTEKEKDIRNKVLVPSYIEIEIALWHREKVRLKNYKFSVPIYWKAPKEKPQKEPAVAPQKKDSKASSLKEAFVSQGDKKKNDNKNENSMLANLINIGFNPEENPLAAIEVS